MNRQHFNLILKMTLVLGTLYFLVKKGLITMSMSDTKSALEQWHLIVPACAAMFFNNMLGVFRWQWLLRAQGIRLTWLKTLQLTFVGNFFNVALPGSVSGDLVKAYYAGREAKGQKARAMGSVLFDRVAGLSALVLVSAIALLAGLHRFRGTPLIAAIRFSMVLAALVVISFYAYLFLVQERHDPLLWAFRRLEKKWAPLGTLARVYESVRHYHNHRVTVLKVLGISMVIHLVVGWAMLQFAHALGDWGLTLLPVWVVVPLGLLVTAVPVMPAGVGTGHAAFYYLFKLIGSVHGADIFTLQVLYSLALAAVSGVVYLRFRTHEPAPGLVPATPGA